MATEEQENPKAVNLHTARGAATAFDKSDKGQYQTNSFMYPNDLLAPDGRYGGNYAVFYININIDGKLAKSLDDEQFVKQIPPRDRGDLIAGTQSKTRLFAANATLNAGGALLGSALGVGNVSTPAAVLGGVGAGATANFAASATRTMKRIKTAIALHIPNQLQIRYGMQYSEEDTLGMAMALEGIDEILSAVAGGGKLADLTDTAQAAVTNLTLSKGIGAAGLSAATGLAANPKKEQIFKGVDFRTFQFDYQFFPRSADEAANVLRIIKEFKYHMHPEFKDANNFVYIYPSEFDIFYYQGGVENLNIHRHTSCVLQEMNVNYTPNGNFTSFANGMPTQINITLNFRELSLLTKDKIEDGL
jgi:hypothetical protein